MVYNQKYVDETLLCQGLVFSKSSLHGLQVPMSSEHPGDELTNVYISQPEADRTSAVDT